MCGASFDSFAGVLFLCNLCTIATVQYHHEPLATVQSMLDSSEWQQEKVVHSTFFNGTRARPSHPLSTPAHAASCGMCGYGSNPHHGDQTKACGRLFFVQQHAPNAPMRVPPRALLVHVLSVVRSWCTYSPWCASGTTAAPQHPAMPVLLNARKWHNTTHLPCVHSTDDAIAQYHAINACVQPLMTISTTRTCPHKSQPRRPKRMAGQPSHEFPTHTHTHTTAENSPFLPASALLCSAPPPSFRKGIAHLNDFRS